jgi:hypothetical protein
MGFDLETGFIKLGHVVGKFGRRNYRLGIVDISL